LDALMVKMRHEGRVENRAVYVAIGIDMQSHKDVLGLWTSAHEGAKFWLQVLTELRNRGIQDIFFACVDGLKGFPAAIEAVFPQTQVQHCIVHRRSSSFFRSPPRSTAQMPRPCVCVRTRSMPARISAFSLLKSTA
jgi:transposase-like protein